MKPRCIKSLNNTIDSKIKFIKCFFCHFSFFTCAMWFLFDLLYLNWVLIQDSQPLHPLQCRSLRFLICQVVAYLNLKQDCEEHNKLPLSLTSNGCKKVLIKITVS